MLVDETSKLQKYIPRRRLKETKQRTISSIALYQAMAANTAKTWDCTSFPAVFELINEVMTLEGLAGDMDSGTSFFCET
jgi:hypothetical protein